MISKKEYITILIIFSSSLLYGASNQTNNMPESRLHWKKIKNAIGYKVQVKNNNNTVVVNKKVNQHHIILKLPYGDYFVRIAKINKFNNLDKWSKWSPVKIRKFTRFYRGTKSGLFEFGIKASIGPGLFILLPEWGNNYHNSLTGINANIGFGLASINKFNRNLFLRYITIEFDSSFYSFDRIVGINKVESNLTHLNFGGNIALSTNFKFPLNFAVRMGLGITSSNLSYYSYNSLGNKDKELTSKSQDIYYKFGISTEYDFHKHFFLELGIDYYSIQYKTNPFLTLRCHLQAGIRF